MNARLTSIAAATLIALAGGTAVAAPAAAPDTAQAALKGPVFKLANQAFAAYNAKRYAQAEQLARRAIAMRPDVLRLRMLLIYALQKQGKNAEALEAVNNAQAGGLQSDELTQAKSNLKGGGGDAGETQSAAFRQGFPIATQAFADYNAQQYESSAKLAEQALRIDPSQGTWALLWITALEAQKQLQAAIDAADTAIALGTPNRQDLVARKQALRKSMSVAPAVSAYQALIAFDGAKAVGFAREAVALSPDTQSHRLLLMTALQLNRQIADGETAATEALQQDDEDTTALVMRAYFRQFQGKTALANKDFDEAIAQDWLEDEQRASLRLIAADAALVAGDYERAKTLVAPLDANDKAVAERLKKIASREPPPQEITAASYPPPAQDCRLTPYGSVCDLRPADGASTASAKAYAAYGKQDYQEAIIQAQKAVEQSPDSPAMHRLLTVALAAGNTQQQEQAMQRIATELEATPDDAGLLMQRAYIHQRRKEPELALEDFRAARATGKAPALAILDEGYALARTGRKAEAVATLKQAIDQSDTNELELDRGQRYNTRGAISGLSREWGASVSTSYRGARPAGSGLNGTPVTTGSDSVFGMADVYWRPPEFLNSSTQVFEVYGRVMSTLHGGSSTTGEQTIVDPCTGRPAPINAARNDGVSGLPTTIGSLGLRFTPSTDYALTFGLERRFLLGSNTRSGSITPASADLRCQLSGRDPAQPGAPVVGNAQSILFDANASSGGWLAYATYGFYHGTGLRFDVPSWFTVEGYVQGGYYREDLSADFWMRDQNTGANGERQRGKYRRDQWFANAEARAGRSFRIDAVSDRLMLFPHLVLALDYQRQNYRAHVPGFDETVRVLGNGSTWSAGGGAGMSVRYAFREDRYHAPRSYVDWTVQYRTNLGGGEADRAKGWFMSLSMWY
ncbi:NfrA family protein [Diaphorobacter aerolatus]|uniref:Tetratricopeptide repeat protein n=1 Tax=Diaphorobacter aerolatus TaxID=1288495 RepID=A0A7H0GPU1_9BURK|nr:tetratricopeptide repeat protein [Diaphorobacter aerolatus]QNP50307.1 tetratricopeptide repeat protein [Diaphorobacter aerolatus]